MRRDRDIERDAHAEEQWYIVVDTHAHISIYLTCITAYTQTDRAKKARMMGGGVFKNQPAHSFEAGMFAVIKCF